MSRANEIKKLEKKVLYTRLSSVLFLAVLVIGSLAGIPLEILTPVVVGGALVMVAVVGIPTQKKLLSLRKEMIQEGEMQHE